ncbi:hypothetical protein [Nocardia sp. NPDC051832]|uniref:hypothetical protein n=1 Tax=Nocardia sp. NPDC051832 TaxID=3155673 RepID=UPI0034387BCA
MITVRTTLAVVLLGAAAATGVSAAAGAANADSPGAGWVLIDDWIGVKGAGDKCENARLAAMATGQYVDATCRKGRFNSVDLWGLPHARY